ncbi:ABC transporter substrate-binding protein [Pseudonocardia halophobica]|uniref:ABC transporter substrate-binding protein n=1 Tax=Pseudonocardia halophobica TaxID=29401 RepID=UPI003D8C5AEF
MLKRRRFAALAALCTASVLALSACGGGSSDTAAQGGAGAPSELAISTSGTWITTFAPLWAAAPEMAEIEKKYNTKISYPGFGKGNDALTAMLGGSAQICNCSFNTALKAALASDELHYVVNMNKGAGTVAIAAKRYEAERGTDLAKFDGGNWGYTSEGSISQVSLKEAAEHSGLDWAKQKGIALGAMNAFAPALQTGRIDIAMMDVASAAQAVKDGIGYPVLNTNDLSVFGPIGGTLIGNGLVMPEKFRQQYPELSQDLVNAVVAGLNRVRTVTDPAKVMQLMPQGFRDARSDPQLFAAEWAFTQPGFLSTDGSTTEQAVKDTTGGGDFSEADLAKPEAGTFLDNSMVDKAYEQLGIPRPGVQTAS